VITDGKQTTTPPYTGLSEASRGIKNKGIIVYALGVGSGADRAELEEIASGSEYVFTSSSFRDLQNIAPRIITRFCAGKNAEHARIRLIIVMLLFLILEYLNDFSYPFHFLPTVPTQLPTTTPRPTTTSTPTTKGILPKFVVEKIISILFQIVKRTNDKLNFVTAHFQIHVSLKAAVLPTISVAK